MSPVVGRSLLTVCSIAVILSSSLSAQDPAPSIAAELGTPSALPQDGVPDIVVATATGAGVVKLFSGAPGHVPIVVGEPFGASFPGGLHIATGDVNDDGIADGVVGMGPGVIPYAGMPAVGGLIRIYSGADASAITEGFPFGPTATGGVFLAIGDVDGDGHGDIIASEGAGAHVRAFSLVGGGSLLADLTPYGPAFTGGVRVATGDVNGDGTADLITAPASGVGTVKVFSTGGAFIGEIMPFEPSFAGGVFIAAGDVDGDGHADIVVSAGGGSGHVKVFRGSDGSELFHLGPGLPSNISVATGDLDVDGHADIIAGLGPGNPPIVAVINGATQAVMFSFVADLSAVDGTPVEGDTGVVVAALASAGIRYTSGDHTTFSIGQPNTFTVSTTASPTVSSITQTGTLPAGLTFTDNRDGTATLSGTPNPGTGGTYSLTFSASNSLDRPATQTFTLRVGGAPQITSANATTFAIGTAEMFAVTTTGFPLSALASAGTLPAGITFTDNGDGTALLAGTPGAGSGGIYPLTITAINGVNPDAVQPFTLTVTCPTMTVAPTSVWNGAFGVPYNPVTFTHTGGGAGGTWSATGLPSGLALDPNTGVLSGTPTTTGVFDATITYTGAASCQGSTPAMRFSVVPNAQVDTYAGLGNTQIVAANHSTPTTAYFSFASSVLANDGGPGLAVTPVTNATTALGGQITIAVNGAFTYTPPAGAKGTDHYVYTVTSSGASSQTAIELDLGIRRVWYIDPSAAAGDGRSTAPFNSLNSVNAPDGVGDADDAGDYIYLYPGTHTGNVVTEANQTLWGAGAAFNPQAGLTIPASGGATILGSVLIVGDGVTISSIAVSSNGNFGIGAANVDLLTIKNDVTVSTSGGIAGVAFQNVNSTPGGAPNFGINFRSVSAQNSAGGRGIGLVNVNQTHGSFTITGDGGTSNNGSGGVIQGVGIGVQLQSARNVSLGYLNILDNSYGIEVTEGSGTYAVHRTNVVNSYAGLSVNMGSTTIESFTVTNSRFTQAPVSEVIKAHAMSVQVYENAVLQNLTVDNSVFEDSELSGLHMEVTNAATLNATIQGSTFRRNKIGLEMFHGASGLAAYRVLNNDFQSHNGHAITAMTRSHSTAAGMLQLRIQGSTIGTTGTWDSGSMTGDGIHLDMQGNARSVALIDTNQLHEIPNGRGMAIVRQLVLDGDALAADVTVTNNTVTVPTGTGVSTTCGVGVPCPKASLFLNADPISTSWVVTLNANIAGNSVYNPAALQIGNEAAYTVRRTGGGGFVQIVGVGDAATQIATTNAVISPVGSNPIVVDTGVIVIPGPIVTPP